MKNYPDNCLNCISLNRAIEKDIDVTNYMYFLPSCYSLTAFTFYTE